MKGIAICFLSDLQVHQFMSIPYSNVSYDQVMDHGMGSWTHVMGGRWIWDRHWQMSPHLSSRVHWEERLWKLLYRQGIFPWQRPGKSDTTCNLLSLSLDLVSQGPIKGPKQPHWCAKGKYSRVWPSSSTLKLLTLAQVGLPLRVSPYLTSSGSTSLFSARAG